uniref:Ribonuclease A-domain domain-containing protein n=1 Tax=Sander lucioperca TaxID=283035 RepID=A0A8C9Z0D4_SANLU
DFFPPQQFNSSVQNFINQHINQNMDPNSCDGVIKQRKISKAYSNKCKKENTFISATYGEVTKVCGDEGEPYEINNRSLRISREKFTVVNCKCNDNLTFDYCGCKGSRPNLRIVIDCDNNGNPVHYQEGVNIPTYE